METKEYKSNLWKEISKLADSLFAQLDEKREGYLASLEELDCNKPLIVYFTKFNLRLDNSISELLKYAKQIRELGIEDDLILEQAKRYEYVSEEIEAFEKWKKTVKLFRDKTLELESLLV